VEGISNYDDFIKLEATWNGVVEKSTVDTPFLTFQWLNRWWQSYGLKNKMLILLVRDSAGIAGIAPLMITRVHRWGVPLKAVTFMANYHTNRAGFIINGDRVAVVGAIISYLNEHCRMIDAYVFDFLQEGAESQVALSGNAAGQKLRWLKTDTVKSPYIPIAGSWAAYVASLSKKWRRKINDTKRHFDGLGNVSIERFIDKDIDSAFNDLLKVSRATWQYENGTAIASTDRDTAMYRALALDMAKLGLLRLWILKIEGVPIAFMYAIERSNKLFALKIGFNKEYSRVSPGVFLSAHVIKECFDRKLTEFEWLGSNDEYKLKWTPLVRQHVQHRIYNHTLFGTAAYMLDELVRAGKSALSRRFPVIREAKALHE
jgi:CelD/BcsL family acetyltransferase involved in cellulose biosynthesis